MDELVKAVVLFLEFVILGVAGILIISAPFFQPIGQLWHTVLDRFVRPDATGAANWMRRSLEAGFLLLAILVVGVLINSTTYWMLQPAHIHVIGAVGEHAGTPGSPPPIHPNWSFFARPFWWSLDSDQATRYAHDSKKQMKWMKESPETNESLLNMLDKQIRLIRGLVVAVVLGLIVGTAFGICAVLYARFPTRWPWNWHPEWPWAFWPTVGYVVLTLFAYVILMTSYWSLEASYHRMVWSWPTS